MSTKQSSLSHSLMLTTFYYQTYFPKKFRLYGYILAEHRIEIQHTENYIPLSREGGSYSPRPPGHDPTRAAWACRQTALLAHIQPSTCLDPQLYFCVEGFSACPGAEVIPPHMQDSVLGLVKLHAIADSPALQYI